MSAIWRSSRRPGICLKPAQLVLSILCHSRGNVYIDWWCLSHFSSDTMRTCMSSVNDVLSLPIFGNEKSACVAWCLIQAQSTTSSSNYDKRSCRQTSFRVMSVMLWPSAMPSDPCKQWIMRLLNTARVKEAGYGSSNSLGIVSYHC